MPSKLDLWFKGYCYFLIVKKKSKMKTNYWLQVTVSQNQFCNKLLPFVVINQWFQPLKYKPMAFAAPPPSEVLPLQLAPWSSQNSNKMAKLSHIWWIYGFCPPPTSPSTVFNHWPHWKFLVPLLKGSKNLGHYKAHLWCILGWVWSFRKKEKEQKYFDWLPLFEKVTHR